MDPITQQTVLACAGAGGAEAATYVDDVFSTFLYDGTGSSNTITNEIDLDGEGGLVWIKRRNGTNSNVLYDTERGENAYLSTNMDAAEYTASSQQLTAFNSDGFTLGTDAWINGSGNTFASWSFRKAPGFFDVVTWTGNGTNRTISHNLGSTPGFIVIKRSSDTEDWTCWHRSVGATKYLQLNGTGASASLPSFMNDTEPTSTEFTVGTHDRVNTTGETYVAYLFAHDDQSFGDDSDEAIIKCGSATNGTFEDLGFEPQWLMLKASASSDSWYIFDTMRGLPVDGSQNYLLANSNGAEATGTNNVNITSQGFTQNLGATNIYIAIRRPHKPPTAGTDVFAVSAAAGNSDVTTNFPVDLAFQLRRTAGSRAALTRLQGKATLETRNSSAETVNANAWYESNTKFLNAGLFSADSVFYLFKRAPGFLDVVAYSGNSTAGRNVSHNLGVKPELMIVKARSGASNQLWFVYNSNDTATDYLNLNATDAATAASTVWNNTEPTSSVFTVGLSTFTNATNYNYIAYLFATLDGISKVGTYSGTGNNVDVDCGFSAGARFVLIKRTDADGPVASNWTVFDTARGIVSGNDPFLYLNTNAAEDTSSDYIDPLNSGFRVTSNAGDDLNKSGGTYLFLAIA